MITRTLEIALPGDRDKIEDMARSNNWKELFKLIINTSYPDVAKSIGDDWKRYAQFMDQVEIVDIDSGEARRIADTWFYSDYLPVSDFFYKASMEEAATKASEASEETIGEQIAEAILDDDMRYYGYDPLDSLNSQADEVDEILVLLKRMEIDKITPEDFLGKLYGQIMSRNDEYSDGEKKVTLNRQLSRLTI